MMNTIMAYKQNISSLEPTYVIGVQDIVIYTCTYVFTWH